MCWLFVPGLAVSSEVSPARLAAVLARSVTWNEERFDVASWSRRCKRVKWLPLLSGATSPRSTASRGVASFIASLRATRVSPSPCPASDSAPRMHAGSGRTLRESFGRSRQGWLFSRTCPLILTTASTRSAETFSAWVTGLRQHCSAQRLSALPIDASGSSYWPTAVRSDSHSSGRLSRTTGERHGQASHQGTSLTDAVRQWPTPTQSRATHRSPPKGDKQQVSLGDAARSWHVERAAATSRFPTPLASDSDRAGRRRGSLKHMVTALWPTPTVCHASNTSPGPAGKRKSLHRLAVDGELPSRTSPPIRPTSEVGRDGSGLVVLNPVFVEILMGFPIGHTDLRAWAKPWFRSKRGKPSPSSATRSIRKSTKAARRRKR